MTALKVGKITGYDIQVMPPQDAHNKYWYGAYREDGTLVASHGNCQPQMALKGLLALIYKMHSQIVFDQQHWRCKQCNGIKPLQADHVIPRSKGRDDRVSNLQGLCRDCHARKHGEHHGIRVRTGWQIAE